MDLVLRRAVEGTVGGEVAVFSAFLTHLFRLQSLEVQLTLFDPFKTTIFDEKPNHREPEMQRCREGREWQTSGRT